ncbi:hypothetical protein TanjilG_01923 [Lupinus angustifolius]|nr:hypothetical protein TanjilG_01923 [Lupinus angustifolius]
MPSPLYSIHFFPLLPPATYEVHDSHPFLLGVEAMASVTLLLTGGCNPPVSPSRRNPPGHEALPPTLLAGTVPSPSRLCRLRQPQLRPGAAISGRPKASLVHLPRWGQAHFNSLCWLEHLLF